MTSLPGISNETVANSVLLASRLLLSGVFVHEGVFLMMNFDGASAGMARLGVPPLVLVLTIALQTIAGFSILVGCQARWGSLALGAFCLATAALFHANFASRNELLQFEKDLAIAGGLFALMVRGAGRWSVDQILRRDRAATAGSPNG